MIWPLTARGIAVDESDAPNAAQPMREASDHLGRDAAPRGALAPWRCLHRG
jgi:hypothetical protein